MTENVPSTMAPNGRRSNGTFAPGHKFSKGNPHASVVAKLRTAALAAVTAKDLAAIMRKLVRLALAGDIRRFPGWFGVKK